MLQSCFKVLISSSEAWSDAADVTLTLVLLSDSSQKTVSGYYLRFLRFSCYYLLPLS